MSFWILLFFGQSTGLLLDNIRSTELIPHQSILMMSGAILSSTSAPRQIWQPGRPLIGVSALGRSSAVGRMWGDPSDSKHNQQTPRVRIENTLHLFAIYPHLGTFQSISTSSVPGLEAYPCINRTPTRGVLVIVSRSRGASLPSRAGRRTGPHFDETWFLVDAQSGAVIMDPKQKFYRHFQDSVAGRS
jgi:hypothetical protein